MDLRAAAATYAGFEVEDGVVGRRPRQAAVPGGSGALDTVEDPRDDGWWRVLATFHLSIPASTSDAVTELARYVRSRGGDPSPRSSWGVSGAGGPGQSKKEAADRDAAGGRDRAGFPSTGARRGNGIVRTLALTTTGAQIIGPSEQRVALLFAPPTAAGLSYTVTTEPSASLGVGLNLSSSTGPLLLTREVFGDAVNRAWFAIASSAFSIGVLETIVDDRRDLASGSSSDAP